MIFFQKIKIKYLLNFKNLFYLKNIKLINNNAKQRFGLILLPKPKYCLKKDCQSLKPVTSIEKIKLENDFQLASFFKFQHESN
jgi:hypothetical protein